MPATEFVRCHQPLHAARTMRFAKNAQHDTSKAPRFPRKMMMKVAKVLRPPRKMQLIFLKRRESIDSIAPATQNDCQQVVKHVGLSRSATPAMRNEATRHWKLPNVTTFAELTIGTAILGSHDRLRTAANGRSRKRNVERAHLQPPDAQSETGTLATHSRKRLYISIL